jgi:hypothetical protein
VCWLPEAHWDRLPLQPLRKDLLVRDGLATVAPYPASLIKLMVAVGVAALVDKGSVDWHMPLSGPGGLRELRQWTDAMLVASCNESTDVLVRLLHDHHFIHREGPLEINRLHELFDLAGLHTLRLGNTTPYGGWRNADGAGVGELHMTSWDTVRLLWLLMPDIQTASAPWYSGPPILSEASSTTLWGMLQDQGLHVVLSTTCLGAMQSWQPGIQAKVPLRWITQAGAVDVQGQRFEADIRAINALADCRFLHKTGHTDNYASDAGWVRGDDGRSYLISFISNLGRHYAPSHPCVTDWSVARMAASIDNALRRPRYTA